MLFSSARGQPMVLPFPGQVMARLAEFTEMARSTAVHNEVRCLSSRAYERLIRALSVKVRRLCVFASMLLVLGCAVRSSWFLHSWCLPDADCLSTRGAAHLLSTSASDTLRFFAVVRTNKRRRRFSLTGWQAHFSRSPHPRLRCCCLARACAPLVRFSFGVHVFSAGAVL